MPFLGQDWRSPGEQWVRTSEGWERLQLWRLKLFENLNENVLARLLKLCTIEDLIRHKEMKANPSQPHLFVTNRLSREKKMQISLAEALTRLDMCGAAKDLRRFNYVCKLLEFLVNNKLNSLSGAAQKMVFNILEEVIKQVVVTNNNITTVKCLLRDLRLGLDKGYYDHVGSSSLWLKHVKSVDRMEEQLRQVQIKERADDGKTTISDLPEDCLREILLRLDNHKDLVSTGLTELRTYCLSQENSFWRDLCLFHFTNAQWSTVIRRGEDLESLGWMTLFNRLSKRYGLRDVYAEMLHMCRHCNILYWEHHGHPCLFQNQPPQSIPVSPALCVELFTS